MYFYIYRINIRMNNFNRKTYKKEINYNQKIKTYNLQLMNKKIKLKILMMKQKELKKSIIKLKKVKKNLKHNIIM